MHMLKEKATRKIAVQKHFAQKSVSGLQYIIGIGCYAPPLFVVIQAFIDFKTLTES